ncbi:hypothetical protein AMECASPLE_002589 [Ameca splendens]|uniref:Uncharacterized protein n=1 Tax=Ameca splendens TaxID=208324 RepID=A0ABV0XMC5_9TELE
MGFVCFLCHPLGAELQSCFAKHRSSKTEEVKMAAATMKRSVVSYILKKYVFFSDLLCAAFIRGANKMAELFKRKKAKLLMPGTFYIHVSSSCSELANEIAPFTQL